MTALHEFSASELSAAYQQGSLSPVEAARAVIAHIERWEPQLCAMYAFDPSTALAMARTSEARWLAGAPLSPLDGVPVTIKENIATRGVPVPMGSAASELTPASEDSPPAARLREAGCVFLGKTTMPDMGMLSSGLSSFHKLARNPWDVRLNPGGSSAGAGAAAAAGYGPLHVGTDIGGSIRLPAGWCGVFGLKPSGGRVPIKPPFTGRVAGPMTRTVQDAALMMAVLSRTDWRDTTSLPPHNIGWDELTIDVRGLKIGLHLEPGWGLPLNAETASAVNATARQFEAAGAIIETVETFMTREAIDGIDNFWRLRSHLDISTLPRHRQDKVLPYIREWAAGGAQLSAAQLYQGYSQMAALREAAVAACQPFDFVIAPVSPVPTYPAEWAGPTNDPARPLEHIAYTLPYNMSEQPAASVNCGFTASGMPIGLQIIGQRFDDLGVLRLARAWELMRGAQLPWPCPGLAASDGFSND